MGRRTRRTLAAALGLLLAAATATVHAAVLANSISVSGDSISRGFNANTSSCNYGDNVSRSWATGDDHGSSFCSAGPTGTYSHAERLECAAAVATSYGVAVRLEIVRTRPGSLGEDVARVAAERRAELVVVGAAVDSQRGFHHAFQREVLLLLRAAPCRVMIATGPVAGRGARATVAGTTVPPWHDGVARRTSSSAFSGRTLSSPPRTAMSARRSTTRSA